MFLFIFLFLLKLFFPSKTVSSGVFIIVGKKYMWSLIFFIISLLTKTAFLFFWPFISTFVLLLVFPEIL